MHLRMTLCEKARPSRWLARLAPDRHGDVSPRTLQRTKQEIIRFAISECWLGSILVAASVKGICCITLGNDSGFLLAGLQNRFQTAEFIIGDEEFQKQFTIVVQWVESPRRGLDLPLDVRGTAFQQRVWHALCAIPCGETVSYSQIAGKIGSPKAVRAVAGACAANAIAIAIPCHRVVRHDGNLSGYRWGVERKRSLLERERRL